MSIFSRLADAEKLSIPQLQMSIKNGTIPAYAGIPLLEQKVKAAQQAKMTQAPQQAPIADAIMQQANSVQGIQNLQSNLPEESYNDGGIVAFADGGESFDYEAYQDQADEAEYAQAIANRLEAADSLQVNRTPSVEKPKEGEVKAPSESGVKAPPGEFYKNIYNTLKVKAEEMGFKHPEAIARVGAAQSALETGYGKALAGGNNYFGIKGSGGNKQSTKEYSPERGYYSAKESFRTYNGMEDSATDYLRLMQNPRYAKVAMAQTPEEAIAAQSRSGYATSPQYGSSLRSIHSKNMAEGGITSLNKGGVAHFFNGGFNNTQSEEDKRINNELNNLPTAESLYGGPRPVEVIQSPNKMSKLFNSLEGQRRVDEINRKENAAPIDSGFFPGSAPLASPNLSVVPNTLDRMAEYEPSILSATPATNPATPAETSNPDNVSDPAGERRKSEYDLIREDIMNQRNDLKRQKQEDKYLAIIAAGLGIAGGTSPNAFANIGQGAAAGITSYSQAARARAAENNALNKGLLSAERYRSMDEMARETLKDRTSGRNFLADERRDAKDIDAEGRAETRKQNNFNFLLKQDAAVDTNIGRLEQGIKNGVLKLMKADSFASLEGDQINKYNLLVSQEFQKAMSQGALKNAYASKQRLQKTLYPDLEYSMPDYGASSSNTIYFDAKGKKNN